MRIILKTRDFLKYPFLDLSLMTKRERMKNMINFNFCKLTFSETNLNDHITYYYEAEKNLSFYVLGGFPDHTFKILKNNKILNSI